MQTVHNHLYYTHFFCHFSPLSTSVSYQLSTICAFFFYFFFHQLQSFQLPPIRIHFFSTRCSLFSTTFDTCYSMCNLYQILFPSIYIDHFGQSSIYILSIVCFQPPTIYIPPLFLPLATVFFNHLKYIHLHKMRFGFNRF